MELIEIVFKPQVVRKPTYPPNGQPYWEQILKKWSQTNYLDGIEDKVIRKNVAMLLENQRLYKEQTPGSPPELLDVVAKVYSNLLANKLVSIQPLLGPAGLVYYSKIKWQNDEVVEVIESEDVVARTKRVKAIGQEKIDIDDLAEKVIHEIDLEILTDLRNNAGTIAKRTNPNKEDMHYVISELIMTISRKSLHKPNWFVVSPNFADKYESTLSHFHNAGYKIYIIEDFLDNTLLMGWQGESLSQGGPMKSTYIYCPYIPLGCLPPVLDPDTFAPRLGYITRYSKKLLRDGAKAFGKLIIE